MSFFGKARPHDGRETRFRVQVVEAVAINGLITVLGLLTGVLQARALGPVGRGELAAIQLWAGLISTFGMLGLQDGVIFFGSKDRSRVGQYSAAASTLIAVSGAALVSAAWVLLPVLLRAQSPATIATARLYLGLFFALALLNVPIFIARTLQRTRLWNALRLLPTLIWVAVIVTETARGTATPARLSLTYLAVLFAVSLFSLLSVRKELRGSLPPRREVFRPMLSFGLPLAFSTIPLLANQRIDQLLLAGVLPAEQLGYYTVGLALSGVALIPTTVVGLVAFPKIAALASREEQIAFTVRIVLLTSVAVTLLALALWVSGPIVVPALFGSAFVPAVTVSAILLLGIPFRGVSQVVHGAAKGMGYPSAVMLSELIGLAAGGLSLVYLLPRFGLVGVAAATSGSSLITCVVALSLLARRTRRAIQHSAGVVPLSPGSLGEQ